MNVFKMCFQSFAVIAAILLSQPGALSQEAASGEEPPDPAPVWSCCKKVRCVGSNFYDLVKASSTVSMDDACAKAVENAHAHCGGEMNVAEILPVSGGVCDLAEETLVRDPSDPEPAAPEPAARQQVSESPWKVRAWLHYCDGSPGDRIVSGGCCERQARAKAYRAVCLGKDPCKRAYITFCRFESPGCPQPSCCRDN